METHILSLRKYVGSMLHTYIVTSVYICNVSYICGSSTVIYRRSIFWWLGALKRERTEKWANLEGVSKGLRTNQRAGILISCEMKLYWWESRGKRNEFTGSFHRLERIWRGKNQTHIFSIYRLNTSSTFFHICNLPMLN